MAWSLNPPKVWLPLRGGPLAAVQTGDRIRLSVSERRLDLLVPSEELERRPRPRLGAVALTCPTFQEDIVLRIRKK